jgi:putative hydrolase of the HAD superfamily
MPAVLFDLDGTLHDRETGLRAFAEAQSREIGLDLSDQARFVRRFIELDRKGRVWKELVYSTIAEELRLGPSVSVPDLVNTYLSKYSEFAVEMAGATKVLTELKNRGFKLGIVTNGRTGLQTSVIRQLGFDRLSDAVVISEQFGAKKPAAEIFRCALDLTGQIAESTVMIGDDFEADILGAHGAGIRSVLFRTQHRSPATASAMNMDEALDAVVAILLDPVP